MAAANGTKTLFPQKESRPKSARKKGGVGGGKKHSVREREKRMKRIEFSALKDRRRKIRQAGPPTGKMEFANGWLLRKAGEKNGPRGEGRET